MTKRNSKPLHKIWRYPLTTLTVIWVICSVLLAFTGPFGSYLSMDFPRRLLYWSGVVSGGTYLSYFLRLAILRIIGNGHSQRKIDVIMAPIFAAVYVPPLYFATEYVTEGRAPYSMATMAIMVIAVTLTLIAIREALGLHAPGIRRPRSIAASADMVFETVVEAEDVAPVPPILDRLAEDQRGEVWAMSGSDHYVEILTSLGKSSVLLRFSDALREVEPIPGQRIHRSHWVSDDAVVTLRHEGKRLFVQLKTGDELPVSRTYVDDARRRWSNADTE